MTTLNKGKYVCFCKIMLLLFGIFILAVYSPITTAKIIDRLVVSINRDDVSLDETFNLIVSANGVAERNDLDTSALMIDFEIIDLNFDKYSYQVNRQLSNSSSWIIKLQPKRTGELVIPPLTLGIASSAEEYIDVSDADENIAEKPSVVRIVSSLSDTNVIVGQQILYTIIVYQDVEVVRRRIYQTFPEQIDATRLGADEYTVEYVAGQPVQFSRRRYMLTVLEEGVIELPPPVFTGVARTRNQGNFGRIFATEEDISISGKAARLNIIAAPSDAVETNLIANKVELSAGWQTPIFKEGDANLLTIQLKAIGSDLESYPDFAVRLPPSLRAYPEKTTRERIVEDENIVSTLTITTAVVPSLAGEIAIPEISVDWYNVNTESIDNATLQFTPVTVQKLLTTNASIKQNVQWYTDFRFYLALCVIISVIYALHVRWLTRKSAIKESDSAPNEIPKAKRLADVIRKRQTSELQSALKSWLDENIGKQPSLSHHQRSQILNRLSPDLCHLIGQFFERNYTNKDSTELYEGIDASFYKSLSDAVEKCKRATQSQHSNARPNIKRYLY